jgi:lipopolysaccharide/colanic/teichoic acid biosynthesis glycosyltransferase
VTGHMIPVLRIAPAKAVTIVTVPTAVEPTPAKVVFDRVAALLLTVPAVPIILAAMLAVKLTSRGPAIYTQTRLGRGGRAFTIYKVRTMRTDAEADGKPRWSQPGDSRVTAVGRFLRSTHLDELPQLWNVLRGDMSLVGPRPERPEIIAALREELPGYDRRLVVKPGVTGVAQLFLPPDETVDSVRRKLAYDCFYIRRLSLGFDLWLIGCTVLKVLGLGRWFRRSHGSGGGHANGQRHRTGAE